MENCKFHPDRIAVRHCKVCGAPLCEECEKVEEKYLCCPKCAKKQLQFEMTNYKRGLIYLYLALVCIALDIALFVIELLVVKNVQSQKTYMIVSIVFFALFLPFCVWLLVKRKIAIKRLSDLITLASRDEVSQDKVFAKKFESNLSQKTVEKAEAQGQNQNDKEIEETTKNQKKDKND